jgi:two-component system, cell cycle response regulator DivK
MGHTRRPAPRRRGIGTFAPVARILIADDARVMRMLLRTWLERDSHTVLEAKTGVEALRLVHEGLATKPVDLVFCDIQMPELSGLQVVDAVRADPRLELLPVILVTTLGHEHDVERGLQRGASDYLPKPITYEALHRALRRHLPQKPAR